MSAEDLLLLQNVPCRLLWGCPEMAGCPLQVHPESLEVMALSLARIAAYVRTGHKTILASTAGKVNRSAIPSNGDSFQHTHEIWIGLTHGKFIPLFEAVPFTWLAF